MLKEVRYAGTQPNLQDVERVQKRRQQAAVNGVHGKLCAKELQENEDRKERKDTGSRARRIPRRLQLKPPRVQKLPRRPRGRVRVRQKGKGKGGGDPGLLLPGLPSAKHAIQYARVVLTATTVIVTMLWNMARSQTRGGARRPVCDHRLRHWVHSILTSSNIL